MKVDLIGMDDTVAFKLRNAYYRGGEIASSTIPCSICRANKESTKKRGHFHGSEFAMCQMKLYRSLNEKVDPDDGFDEMEVHLQDGHLHEHTLIGNLDIAGLPVIHAANKPEFEKIMEYTIKETDDDYFNILDGKKLKIVCHWDGMLSEDDEDILLEVKAVSKYTWDKIRKSEEISDIWYGQIQCYLNVLKLNRAYLFIKNRATSKIMNPIRIDKNNNFIKNRIKILEGVLAAILQKDGSRIIKEEKNGKGTQCKFCRFKKDCWGKDEPLLKENTTEEIVEEGVEIMKELFPKKEESLDDWFNNL